MPECTPLYWLVRIGLETIGIFNCQEDAEKFAIYLIKKHIANCAGFSNFGFNWTEGFEEKFPKLINSISAQNAAESIKYFNSMFFGSTYYCSIVEYYDDEGMISPVIEKIYEDSVGKYRANRLLEI